MVIRKMAKRYTRCTLEFLPVHGPMMVLPERAISTEAAKTEAPSLT